MYNKPAWWLQPYFESHPGPLTILAATGPAPPPARPALSLLTCIGAHLRGGYTEAQKRIADPSRLWSPILAAGGSQSLHRPQPLLAPWERGASLSLMPTLRPSSTRPAPQAAAQPTPASLLPTDTPKAGELRKAGK